MTYQLKRLLKPVLHNCVTNIQKNNSRFETFLLFWNEKKTFVTCYTEVRRNNFSLPIKLIRQTANGESWSTFIYLISVWTELNHIYSASESYPRVQGRSGANEFHLETSLRLDPSLLIFVILLFLLSRK